MKEVKTCRQQMKPSSKILSETGMILLSTVLFLGVLALTASTAFFMATTEMKIGANHKLAEQAYYRALAGCEEARARLRKDAAHPIMDDDPGRVQWRVYIGDENRARAFGYLRKHKYHSTVNSLRPGSDAVVEIRHQTDLTGKKILFWGDEDGNGTNEKNTTVGEPVYCITSHYQAEGFQKIIQVETVRIPALPVPGALYVKSLAAIQGSNTHISGMDHCGRQDRVGMVTTKSTGSVTLLGGAQIQGTGENNPNVQYDGKDLDMQKIINAHKKKADFSYVVKGKRQTPESVPGPGDGWGVRDSSAPPWHKATHMVHYQTDGTYVQLDGGITGGGLLLVEGDLEVSGDFTWYGVIVATGSVLFTGGGDKEITGAILAGESALIGDATGRTTIDYCSKAIEAPTENRPLRILSWKEVI